MTSDLGWTTSHRKTPYFVTPLELDDLEKRVYSVLLERLLDEPSASLSSLLRKVCESENLLLERKRGEKILRAAEKAVNGFGVLDFLLQDDELEEISVIGVGKPIFVYHRSRGWLETNASYSSEQSALDSINKMARSLGRRITFQNPRLNAVLPDGSRLHASIAPVCSNGIEMTIRKFKKRPFHALDLVECNTVSLDAVAFLWTVLYGEVSLCVAGNTGSGKTTTLNALFSFLPLGERIVVAEETPELYLPQEHVVRLVSNDELGIGMRDLVRDTLRMRPDRMVVGEVRGKDEVQALFDSLLAGQAKGSFFTIHGDSASEALLRMQSFGISREDLNAIDLVMVQKRVSLYDSKSRKTGEARRVLQLCEVHEGKPVELFRFSDGLKECKSLGSSSVVEKVLSNYGFSRKEFFEEVEKRKKFLHSVESGLDYLSFTKAVQSFAFSSGEKA